MRQLLLNKGHVRQLAFLPHTKALMVQHRAVWGQNSARWLQKASEMQSTVSVYVCSVLNTYTITYILVEYSHAKKLLGNSHISKLFFLFFRKEGLFFEFHKMVSEFFTVPVKS